MVATIRFYSLLQYTLHNSSNKLIKIAGVFKASPENPCSHLQASNIQAILPHTEVDGQPRMSPMNTPFPRPISLVS